MPTIGFGATYYPNGSKVTMNDKPITEAVATDLLANIDRYETGLIKLKETEEAVAIIEVEVKAK